MKKHGSLQSHNFQKKFLDEKYIHIFKNEYDTEYNAHLPVNIFHLTLKWSINSKATNKMNKIPM